MPVFNLYHFNKVGTYSKKKIIKKHIIKNNRRSYNMNDSSILYGKVFTPNRLNPLKRVV